MICPAISWGALKTVTVQWEMQDTTNVQGYKVYYAYSSDMADQKLACQTADPTVTELTCSGVDIERYPVYFTVAAIFLCGESVSVPKEISSSDSIPPSDITNFSATPQYGQISLYWTNPMDSDFAGVMICYRTDGTYPVDYTDGTPVPNGNDGRFFGDPGVEKNFVHTGLDSNLTYYYSAFTYDISGNYTETVHANARPLPPTSPPPNSAPSLDGVEISNSKIDNPGKEITFIVQASDSDGDSLTYTYDFGDGTVLTTTSNQVSHKYLAKGHYILKVVVDDGQDHNVENTYDVTVDDLAPSKPSTPKIE